MTIGASDADAMRLFRLGGISALMLALAYVVITALYVPMGAPPSGCELRLAYVSANTSAWWTILALSVFTDFLFVPFALSLFVALQPGNRTAMLLATACVMLFVVLDLTITWTNYAALIVLSDGVTRAANEAQRQAAIASAQYPCALLKSTLLFVYNTLVLAVGILITGLVMLKGMFGNSTAYLGIATGVLGIISVFGPLLVPALSVTIIITSVLTMLWLGFAGWKLYALGRRQRQG